jgi:hypothetical protein
MDQLKGALGSFGGGNKESNQQGQIPNPEGSTSGHPQPQSQQSGGGGFMGGLTEKFNSAAGGGRESEKNEDYLDKGRRCHTEPSYSSWCWELKADCF